MIIEIGTLNFISNDSQAGLPDDTTFAIADAGTHVRGRPR
jgi:hypothetical protein